jgi:leucyl-tRNA synthetase
MLAEMEKPDSKIVRRGPKDSFYDRVFEEEINELIETTKTQYELTYYKDALKFGFYEIQSARDRYRDVTTDIGMHADLITYFIRTSALLVCPIAPHFAEHLWSTLLKEPQSIQSALYPTPTKSVDKALLEAAEYMRTTLKTIRDAEIGLQKRAGKRVAAGAAFDLSKPKGVRLFVAKQFPEWQEECVSVVKECFDFEKNVVDDAKLREGLTKKGLMKDKRSMPFVQAFKKRIAQFGAQTAFKRTLPFSETEILETLLPYLKRSCGFVEAEVWTVEDAKSKIGEVGFTQAIIEQAEPGTPGFVFWNP